MAGYTAVGEEEWKGKAMSHIPDTGKMVETPRTDAVIARDTGDSGLIAELAREARSMERELQEAQARIRLLIAERDSARQQASQNWKLRDEFAALLGTDDVEEAVCRLKRWKALREAVVKESQTTDHSGGSNKMVELEALNRELVRMAQQISTQTK